MQRSFSMINCKQGNYAPQSISTSGILLKQAKIFAQTCIALLVKLLTRPLVSVRLFVMLQVLPS